MSFEARVRAVDWSRLAGAYGASDESTRGDDVGATLIGLSRGELDADDEVLAGHVWHQGTIYPVTPVVVPFLWELVQRDTDDRALSVHLRQSLWMIHQSAPAAGALGEAVFAATEGVLGPVDAWTTDGSELYDLVRAVMPRAREVLIRAIVERDERAVSRAVWVVLANAEILSATLVDWVAERLERGPVDATRRAELAAIAARSPRARASRSLARAIHAGLSAAPTETTIETDEELWVWAPRYPAADAFALPDEWAADYEATVFFAGASSTGLMLVPSEDIVFQTGLAPLVFAKGARTNVMVHVTSPELRVGAKVRIGFHPNSRVRLITWVNDRGEERRRAFGVDGQPLAPP